MGKTGLVDCRTSGSCSGRGPWAGMDRALSILGADVAAPVIAQKQEVVKVLTKKEIEAKAAKAKDEAKRKKAAEALAALSAGKPKLTKAQAAAAKAKAEGRAAVVDEAVTTMSLS